MEQYESRKFNFQFEHEAIKYVAYVSPVIELTPGERKMHMIREDSFLVHLLDGDRFISFEMYVGEEYEWETSVASLLVDSDLLQIIGGYIDREYA